MSLENYTTRGNILPIGMLVCGNCKDKHLKGVDFSNSQVFSDSETSNPRSPCRNNSVSITTIPSGEKISSKPETDVITVGGGVTISRAGAPVTATAFSAKEDVCVAVQGVQRKGRILSNSLRVSYCRKWPFNTWHDWGFGGCSVVRLLPRPENRRLPR